MRTLIGVISLGFLACTTGVSGPSVSTGPLPEDESLPIDPSLEEPEAPDEPPPPPPPDEPPPEEPPPEEPPPEEPPPEEPPPEEPPPVASATRLTVTVGPDDAGAINALPGCQCIAPAPAANVDLAFGAIGAAGGTVCAKPTTVSCGIDGPGCACGSLGTNLGDASWGSGRTEEPRQPGEQWIVAEQIVHTAGGDGRFFVRANLVDDCLVSPGSLSLSANYGCCLLDCDGTLGNACYDYSQGGASCSLFCDAASRAVTNADCMARGPTPVRVRLESDGGAPLVREWCVTLSAGQSSDVIEVLRSNGQYEVVDVDPAAL